MKKENEEKIGKETLKLKSDKIRERNRKIRYVKLTLLVMTLFLIIIYFLLKVVYATGNFTVSLDPNFAKKQGLIMYERKDEKEDKRILEATKL